MFFVKRGNQLHEIDDESLVTICPDCGCLVNVEPDDMIASGHVDLYGLSIRCTECSYLHALQHRGEAWAESIIAGRERGRSR